MNGCDSVVNGCDSDYDNGSPLGPSYWRDSGTIRRLLDMIILTVKLKLKRALDN